MASLIEQPNKETDFQKEMQVHKKIRVGMVMIVVGALIMSLIVMNGNKEEGVSMKFNYVDCEMEETENGSIRFNLNATNVYRIKVIGTNDYVRVEMSNNSIIGQSSVEFNIAPLKYDHMVIFIEVENLTLEIKECRDYPMGE